MAFRRAGRYITCQICGKKRWETASNLKKGKGKYCSPACVGKANAQRRVRESWKRVEENFGLPVKEVFKKLFIEERLNISEVAREIGTDRNTIYRWARLLDFSIPEYDHNRTMKKFFAQMTEQERKKFVKPAHAGIKKSWSDPQIRQKRIKEYRVRLIQNNIELQNRKEPTSIESKVYEALEKKGIKHCRQYIVNNKFTCDVAIPEKKIIIEIHGDYWHANPELFPCPDKRQRSQIRRDMSKKAYLEKCGYTVIYLWESEINDDLDGCINRVLEILSNPDRPVEKAI